MAFKDLLTYKEMLIKGKEFPSPDGVMAFKDDVNGYLWPDNMLSFRPLMGLWPLKMTALKTDWEEDWSFPSPDGVMAFKEKEISMFKITGVSVP